MRAAKAPLLSPEALDELEVTLDAGLCRDFVRRFIDMWPRRFERIYEAVTTEQHEDALDAALSLRSASIMVGGVRLGALITEIIQLVEGGAYAPAIMKLSSLQRCGNETTCQLASDYLNAG